MNTLIKLAVGALLAVTAAFAAHATTIDITAQPGQWHAFDIDDLASNSGGTEWIDLNDNFGDPLSFTFTVGAARTYLSVVDAGFAGDRFVIHLFDGSSTLDFQTGAAVDSFPASVANDYDAAWADPGYSRFTSLELAPGTTYTVTGELLLSAGGGAPLNVTTGALMVTVPEPASLPLLAAGLAALFGVVVRRRA